MVSLKSRADSLIGINLLAQVAPAGIHAASFEAGFNFSFGENANEFAVLLALLQCLNLVVDNASNHIA